MGQWGKVGMDTGAGVGNVHILSYLKITTENLLEAIPNLQTDCITEA